MRLSAFLVVLATGLFFSQFSFAQSAWTRKKGESYLQLSYSQISDYETLFVEEGNDFETGRTVNESTLQAYGEYGISDELTVSLAIPVMSISTNEINPNSTISPVTINEDTVTSLGNIQLGARYKLYSKKFILTAGLNIEANTSDYDEASGIRTGADAWSFSPIINLGAGFGRSYLQAFTGVQLRTNNYSHNFRFGIEYGYKLLSRLWLAAFVDITQSLKNGDISLPSHNFETGLFINDQEVIATGIKAIFELNDQSGLTFGYGGAVSGVAVPKSPAITFGYFVRL